MPRGLRFLYFIWSLFHENCIYNIYVSKLFTSWTQLPRELRVYMWVLYFIQSLCHGACEYMWKIFNSWGLVATGTSIICVFPVFHTEFCHEDYKFMCKFLILRGPDATKTTSSLLHSDLRTYVWIFYFTWVLCSLRTYFFLIWKRFLLDKITC